MDLRQSPYYARFMAGSGWEIKKFSGHFVYLKNFFGLKFAKMQRFKGTLNFEKLDQFLNANRVIYTVLEPVSGITHTAYTRHRFLLSRAPYLPTKTLIIDLRLTKTKLFQNLSTNLKRILKQPSGTRVIKPASWEFYAAWKQATA